MSLILPINLDNLLHQRSVESERIEFKATWDPHTTGPQVLKRICAFANDLHNLNGGYIVLGVAERDGRAVFPPSDLRSAEIEGAQTVDSGTVQPPSIPPTNRCSLPETVDGRDILGHLGGRERYEAASCPGRASGPTQILGPSRLGDGRRGEGSQRAPADAHAADRPRVMGRSPSAGRPGRGFCAERGSGNTSGTLRVGSWIWSTRRMSTGACASVTRVNGHDVPRNVGLLFFTDRPDALVPGRPYRGRAVRGRPGGRCPGGTDVFRWARRSAPRMFAVPGESVGEASAQAGASGPGAWLGELSAARGTRDPGQRGVSPEL